MFYDFSKYQYVFFLIVLPINSLSAMQTMRIIKNVSYIKNKGLINNFARNFSVKDKYKKQLNYRQMQNSSNQRMVNENYIHDSNMDKWVGESYHQNSFPQYGTARTILSKINFKHNACILDLGCGSGDVTEYVASLIPQGSIIGIDSSADMIKVAKEKNKRSNVEFFVGDIRDYDYPKETFDCILAFNCLHWIEDLDPVLENIKKSLKSGGMLVVAMAHTHHFLYQPLLDVANSIEWASYFVDPNQKPWYAHNPDSFEKIVKRVQLHSDNISVWNKTLHFENTQQFSSFIDAWIGAVPHVNQVPVQLRSQFIYDIIEHFLGSVDFRADGSFAFVSPILVAIIKKQ